MHKKFKILIIALMFIITGCGKDKYKICKLDLNNKSDNYILDATYKVYYSKGYVTKVEKSEIYESDDEDILKYFNDSKSIEYKNLNELYQGYSYDIKLLDGSINIASKVDMSTLDINKMVKDGFIDKGYTSNGRITLNGIKYVYTSKGFNCDI